MGKIFEPKVRDKAMETICSNLIWAGVLLKTEVGKYMVMLVDQNDFELAKTLLHSRLLLDNYLENCWVLN